MLDVMVSPLVYTALDSTSEQTRLLREQLGLLLPSSTVPSDPRARARLRGQILETRDVLENAVSLLSNLGDAMKNEARETIAEPWERRHRERGGRE